MSFCRLAKSGMVLLFVKAVPNAPKTVIDGLYGEAAIKIRVHAPPVDGAANIEIAHFLATFFDLKRSAIGLVSGEKSRDKVFSIGGVSIDEISTKILNHILARA